MILVEELRIGNYVYSGIYSNKVIEVYPMFFVQLFKIEDKEHNIKPIPLTEEWLIKFGFIKQKGIYRSFYQSNDNNYLSICFDEDRYYFMDVNEDPSFSAFNYIHQLQNLYFALTNKELTYDKEIQTI